MIISDLIREFNVVIDTAEGLTELRSLILGLAVRGKLVPQYPNDEPASELLKKIEAEKEQLYEEDEIREVLKLDDVDESEYPFQIPNKWKWTKIGTFSYLEMGQSPPSKHYNEVGEGLPFYQGKTDFGDIYPTPTTWCTEPNKIALSGDILISVRAPVGPTNICEERSCIGRGIAAIRPIAETDTDLIMYFMRAFEDRIKEDQTGSTFKAINKKNLSNFFFPLPPLAEQHRIVQKIESLFAEVDELEAKLNRQSKLDEKLQLAVNAEVQKAPDAQASKSAWNFITSHFDTLYHTPDAIDNLKKNILNEAVRGRLVSQNPNDEPASELLKKIEAEKERLYEEGEIRKPKDLPPVEEDEIPFEIPESWVWTRLGFASINITDGFHSTPNTVDDGIPYVMATHIKDGDIDFENCLYVSDEQYKEIKNKINLKKGDLLVVNIGASSGKAVINPVEFDFCFKNVAVINKPDEIQKDYLYRYFLLNRERILNEVTQGGAQPYLSLKMLNNLEFPLPPLEEQQRIIRRIEELFAICNRFKAQLEQREKVNERLVKGLVQEVLEEAGSSEKEVVLSDEISIAAEPQEEYLTKQQLVFWQILVIAYSLRALKKKNMLQGEMGLAKYVYLIDRIGKVNTHFKFEQNNFGPYPSNFRRRLFTKSKYFYKKGKKDYEVIDLSEKSDRLFEKQSEKTKKVISSMEEMISIFQPFEKNRAEKLELMASVCWLIEKTHKTDFETIWEELENWETPKRDYINNKAELFTQNDVKKVLQFIKKNEWYNKLVR